MKNLLCSVLILVIFSCKKNDLVIYKIISNPKHKLKYYNPNPDVIFIVFSKEKVSPELVHEKILNGDFKETYEEKTWFIKELGQDDGFLWSITFQPHDWLWKNNDYQYLISINRVSSLDIKKGTVLTLKSTDNIPLKWFGWWGDEFTAKVNLDKKI